MKNTDISYFVKRDKLKKARHIILVLRLLFAFFLVAASLTFALKDELGSVWISISAGVTCIGFLILSFFIKKFMGLPFFYQGIETDADVEEIETKARNIVAKRNSPGNMEFVGSHN